MVAGLVEGMLEDRAPDAAFIACPMYEWFKPDSYNYSMTKEERARVVPVSYTHLTLPTKA